MQSKHLLIIVSIFLVSCLVSGYFFWQGITKQTEYKSLTLGVTTSNTPQFSPSPNPTKNKDEIEFKVTRVVDGDTIEIDYFGEPKKLRYIGVNTPETVDPRRAVQCFGKEASNENKGLVEGKMVSLEKDVSETDKFGRLLRYVFIKIDDGSTLFVNDYLVREGYAQVDTFPPDVKYASRFLAAQQEAKANLRGLWSKCM